MKPLPRASIFLLALLTSTVPLDAMTVFPAAECACEAAYTISASGGACDCAWLFLNPSVTEGDCLPEPQCTQIGSCKVTGTLEFAGATFGFGAPCAGSEEHLEATAPCRATGSNEIVCSGGDMTIKLVLVCQPCTPS